jgi:HK97 family phage prohead protease
MSQESNIGVKPGLLALAQVVKSGEREVRCFPNQELRANIDERVIDGFIPYDSDSELIAGYFIETVRDTAFERALNGEDDTVVYWSHSRKHPLARRSANNLTLKNSKAGLHYSANLRKINTTYANDLLENISNKLVNSSSFGFRIASTQGEKWWRDKKTGVLHRELLDVHLPDLSPVTEPAYPNSKVSARSLLLANEINADELGSALLLASRGVEISEEHRSMITETIELLQSSLSSQETDNVDQSPSAQQVLRNWERDLDLAEAEIK